MTISAKNFLSVFFLALLVRLVYLFYFIPDDFNFRLEDQDIYVNLALSMLETGDFVRNIGDSYVVETERTPLYPAFLAIIWSVFEYNPWVVIFVQSILDSITCVIIGLISSLIIPRSFLLGGVLSAANMNLVVSSGLLLTDTLFLFGFSLFLYFSIVYLKNTKLKYLILLSFALSFSILIRPVSYYLIFILLACLPYFLFFSKKSWKIIIMHVVIFLLAVFLFLTPLIDRNYTKFNTTSITSQSGLHLSKYLVPLAMHFSEGVSYKDAVKKVYSKIENREKSIQVDKNPFEVSYLKSRVSLECLFELGVSKVAYSWVMGSVLNLISSGVMAMPVVRGMPHQSFYNTEGKNTYEKIINFLTNVDSLKYLLLVILSNLVSFFLFMVKLFGAYVLVKNMRKQGVGQCIIFFFGIIMYFLLITGPIIGVKYMLPIEPLLTILLIAGLYNIKIFKFLQK